MAVVFFLLVIGVTLLNIVLCTALLASSCIPGEFPVLQLPEAEEERVSGVFLVRAAERIAS